jgi:predicted signal transduction protein with EAL and GGDEF domain
MGTGFKTGDVDEDIMLYIYIYMCVCVCVCVFDVLCLKSRGVLLLSVVLPSFVYNSRRIIVIITK